MSFHPAGKHPVILFDGVCNLCDRWVNYIIKKDRKKLFLFASLQSAAGQSILRQHAGSSCPVPDSLVLYHDGKIYFQSDAALRVAVLLGGWWKCAGILMLIPRPMRNGVYDFIARNRYKFWGKKDICMIPSPEVRSRFLDDVSEA